MTETKDVVCGLTDIEAIQVAERVFDEVYAHVPYSTVRANAAAEPRVESLLALGEDQLLRELSPQESAALSREVLLAFAADPGLAPFVADAVDEVRQSDELVVGTILALGLVTNLTLLVCTTELSLETDADGKRSWKLQKREVTPELMKTLNPLMRAVEHVSKVVLGD